MHDQMAAYYRRSCYLPYWYADSKSAFVRGRGTNSLFRQVYDFSSICSAMVHVAYWMCLLSLTQSRLSILKSCSRIIHIDTEELMRLEKLSKEYANNISMSIPWFANPKNGWAGRIMAMRPLNFLLLHYRQRNEWDKVSWCVGMTKDLGIYNGNPSQNKTMAKRNRVNVHQTQEIGWVE